VTPTDTALFVPIGNGQYALSQNSGQSSKQTYVYRDNLGACYSRTLTAAANVLTNVEDGQGCRHEGAPW
jgi:hypothetical protein